MSRALLISDVQQRHLAESSKSSKWFLLDWDDANVSPTRPANHLGRDNHALEVFEKGHGGEVDIWSIRRLITNASKWITVLGTLTCGYTTCGLKVMRRRQ
jgi:hypothetical protein